MTQVNVRPLDGEKEAWKQAAGKTGINAWLRKVADEASGFPYVEVKRGRPFRCDAPDPEPPTPEAPETRLGAEDSL